MSNLTELAARGMTGAPSGSGSRPAGRASKAVSPVPASIPSAGALKVWWIPQVPMAPFEAAVPNLATAAAILDVLADYDAYQFRTNVKGDYSNTGGLLVLRADGEWEDWEDPDTCDDFDQWRDENLPKIMTNGWRDRDLTASAIDQRAETLGSVEDESAVAESETPSPDAHAAGGDGK